MREEMNIILSSTVQSKNSFFTNLILEEQHQLEFFITIVQKATTVYHLYQYKTGTELLIVSSCYSLLHKI